MKFFIALSILFGPLSFSQTGNNVFLPQTKNQFAQISVRAGEKTMRVDLENGEAFEVPIPKKIRPTVSIFERPVIGPVLHFTAFNLVWFLSSKIGLALGDANPYIFPVVHTIGSLMVVYFGITDTVHFTRDLINHFSAKKIVDEPQSQNPLISELQPKADIL